MLNAERDTHMPQKCCHVLSDEMEKWRIPPSPKELAEEEKKRRLLLTPLTLYVNFIAVVRSFLSVYGSPGKMRQVRLRLRLMLRLAGGSVAGAQNKHQRQTNGGGLRLRPCLF